MEFGYVLPRLMTDHLAQSAKFCPHCMFCGKANPNGDLLCLAHSNSLRHGRGSYHKSDSIFGAIVCMDCHDQIDGRKGGLSKEVKRDMHQVAHDRTLSWWLETGHVRVSA